MTVAIRKAKTWSLTWERRKDGKPILDSKGNARRTGNYYFSEQAAKDARDRVLAAGRNPSEVEVKDMDWICG